ncbi:major facilitator superfamily domain-containing protein [Pelagophyceae sp. CCMP2097]|nr:major facilitator superfamily domain-containing protein [Pelagophyceae sp. CCMP2097]
MSEASFGDDDGASSESYYSDLGDAAWSPLREAEAEPALLADASLVADAPFGDRAAWGQLYGGFVLISLCGPVFAFGALSSSFQHALGCNAGDAAVIGLAGDLGMWLNILPGAARDRFGDRLGYAVGSVMVAAGYSALAAALAAEAYAAAAVAWFVVGHGCAWLYTTALLTNVTNFEPRARGYAVGTLQSFFGLSATLLIQLYVGCVGGSVVGGRCEGGWFGATKLRAFFDCLGAATVCAAAACLASSRAARRPSGGAILARATPAAYRRFDRILVHVAVILVYMVVASEAGAAVGVWSNYGLLALYAALYVTIFHLDATSKAERRSECTYIPGDVLGRMRRSFTRDPAPHVFEVDGPPTAALLPGAAAEPPPSPPPDMRPLQVMKSRKFYLLFVAFGATVGGTIATSNSMVTIAKSRRSCDSPALAASALTLLTATDALARIASGLLINKFHVDGSTVLVAATAGLCASQVVFALFFSSDTAFRVAATLSGAADGAAWTACPWLVAKLFGAKHYGANFGLTCLSSSFAMLAFTYVVIPRTSRATEAPMHCPHATGASEVCYGKSCFHGLHVAVAACAAIGIVCAAALDSARRQPKTVPNQ